MPPMWKVLFALIYLLSFIEGKVKCSQAKPRTRPILRKDLPENTTVEIGKNVTMKCLAVDSGTLSSFRWIKWDKSFTFVSKIKDNLINGPYRLIDLRYYHSLQSGDEYGSEVTITNVTEDDFGLYTCYASNHIGAEYNSAFLSRFVRPTTPSKRGKPVFSEPNTLKRAFKVWPVSHSVKLKCKAKGAPPLSYTWLKDGELLKGRRLDPFLNTSIWYLKLKDLVPNDDGQYTCIVSNRYGSINHTYTVRVLAIPRTRPILQENLPENTSVEIGENATMKCRVLISSIIPGFRWIKWDKSVTFLSKIEDNLENRSFKVIDPRYYRSLQSGDGYGSEVTIANVTEDDFGLYTCYASNDIGAEYNSAFLSRYVRPTTPSKRDSPRPTSATLSSLSPSSLSSSKQKIFVGALVFGCVVFAVFFGIGIYCHQRKKKLGKGAKHDLDCSPQQSEMAVEYIAKDPSIVGSSPSRELTVPLMRQESRNLTKVSEVDMSVDENLEIDRELINLQEVLGEGAFARVMKAEVFGIPNMPFRCHVAVKMIKEDATEQEHTDLVSELELLKTIGKHKNIISLIGACTQGGPLYVVVEFPPNGDLRQFLRKRRPSREIPTTLTAFRDRRRVREKGSTLTYMDLVSFSYQVCRGMEYLSSKKCIHRDLAARNVLVAEDNTMKIADFGLCRDVHLKGYYRKTTDGLLPVKWMAVESLFDRVYNTQSDVWSFGILLWEMVTFGGSPYPGVPLETLFELLKSGYRMKKPLCCPENMYQIMLKCWHESPMQRPSFGELVKEFDAMLVSLSDKVDSTRQLEEEEIHQEELLMITLATRASNSALVSPSTPRNTGGTEHGMENDGRDNDHDTNVIWEARNPSIHTRQLKRDQKLQSRKITAGDKKKTSDATCPRLPIESNV